MKPPMEKQRQTKHKQSNTRLHINSGKEIRRGIVLKDKEGMPT